MCKPYPKARAMRIGVALCAVVLCFGACKKKKTRSPCPDGFTLCGHLCVDTSIDAEHCGECDHACDTGVFCEQSLCRADCPVETVSSATELRSVIDGLQWASYGPYTVGHLPISCDVQVQGTVTVDASDLVLPEFCANRPDCRNSIGIINMSAQAGVTTENTWTQPFFDDPDRLIITDATVRFRAVYYDTHPMRYNFIPRIGLFPPEAYGQCLGIEWYCGVDRVCYDVESEYCRHCMALDRSECACFEGDGFLPDGTECQYFESGDMIVMGECNNRVCESNWQ